jgi:hypothetical protein
MEEMILDTLCPKIVFILTSYAQLLVEVNLDYQLLFGSMVVVL